MKQKTRNEIAEICKQFARGFEPDFPSINGTGWLIVDPMSAYLNFEGYKHTLYELPANDERPQVMVMEFPDGSKFIPAGEDLKYVDPSATNWMWL